MRAFNYSKIKEEKWDSEILGLIAAIYKFAGKQELYLKQRPDELEKLVEIAHVAKDILKIDNVDFVCDDYNHWKTVNRRKFDIIFSFAIHIWIGTTPEEYARDIYKMLNNNGVFFFESQTLESDVKYVDYCREFECVGLKKIREDDFSDDGKTNRRFTIFLK